MKKVFIFFVFTIIFSKVYSQDRQKVYFLADTMNVSQKNNFLNIKIVSVFEHWFIFYCKCFPPYKSYVTFYYIDKYDKEKSAIVSKKPDYPYITLKKLMDMSSDDYNNFDLKYDLYITERLPKNTYRTNKVLFLPYQQPLINSVTLEEK